MEEKDIRSPAPASSDDQLSFERILGWFGVFTPQLKFRIMALKRHMSLADFEIRVKDILSLFRVYFSTFSKIPAGKQRALAVYHVLDKELSHVAKDKISCRKGCFACCASFPKQITNDEADLLSDIIAAGLPVDFEELRRQAYATKSSSNALALSNTRCVFLGDQGNCQVYEMRPTVCRKYHVVSPSSECEKSNGQVTPQIDLVPEVVVSASLSLPGNELGWMPQKIWEHLEAKAAPPQNPKARES